MEPYRGQRPGAANSAVDGHEIRSLEDDGHDSRPTIRSAEDQNQNRDLTISHTENFEPGSIQNSATADDLLNRSPSSAGSISSDADFQSLPSERQSTHLPEDGSPRTTSNHVDNSAVGPSGAAGQVNTHLNEASPPRAHSLPQADSKKLWEPRILHRSSLWAFVISFLAIAIVLPIMYAVSATNHGLSSVNFRYHYLCTYGPTAVFTLVMAFWNSLEFRVKQLFPWILMQREKTPASQSVLLDYVSSWNVIVLFKSLRRKQFFVSLAITGTLLIQLILVVSTGLFVIQSTGMTEKVPVKISQTFDASNFGSYNRNNRYSSPLPFAASYAAQNMGLGFPFGSTQYSVFPEFTSDRISGEDATLSADVDVLSFDVSCEKAEVRLREEPSPHGGLLSFDLVTPSCTLKKQWGAGTHEELDTDFCTQPSRTSPEHETRVYYYNVERSIHPPGLPYWSGEGKNETSYIRISALLCSASYNITQGRVTYRSGAEDGIRSAVIQLSKSRSRMLHGVTSSDILLYLFPSLWQVLGYTFDSVPHWPSAHERKTNISSVAEPLRNALGPTGVQLIKESLLGPASTSTIGLKTSQEKRLFVRLLSFAVIESALILLALITVGIVVLYTPCAVCPTDPSTIGGIAAMTARSDALMQSLDGLGAAKSAKIEDKVKASSYQSVVDTTGSADSFKVIQSMQGSANSQTNHSPAPANPPDAQPVREGSIKWWQPPFYTWPVRISIIVLSVGLIVALELLYQDSHSNTPRGLATVPRGNRYIRYVWSYIPGLTMLCVQLLFGSLYADTKLFQPFHALRVGAAKAKQSIMDRQIGTDPFVSLWQAVLKFQPAVISISLAAVLAPFLTIVVSGLFFADSVHQERAALASHSFQWDIQSLPNGVGVSEGTWKHDILPPLLLYTDLAYPPRTYKEYVFPALEEPKVMGSNAESHYSRGSKLKATVPALRSVFNCTAVPHETIHLTVNRASGAEPGDIWFESSHLLHECGLDRTSAIYNEPKKMSAPEQYFDAAMVTPTDYWSRINMKCPTYIYAFGKLTSLTSPEDASMVYCWPYIEQVEADVTFLLPDYTIDTENPPRINQNAAKVLYADADKGLNGQTVEPWGWDHSPALPNIPTGNAATNDLSELGKALVHGIGGIHGSEMLGQQNVGNLIDRLENVFGVFMAQFINSYCNNPSIQNASRADSLPSYKATIIEPTHTGSLRLIQSVVSTRILEALLAAITLCAIITFLTIDTRRLLPKDPGSIAAMLSLLAGSEMLKNGMIPPGSEFADNKALLKIFDGFVFSMGWWENGGKFRFGIDVGERPGKDVEELKATPASAGSTSQ